MSMGDCATLSDRKCGCPMETLGWRTHLHTIRSFEKLTAGGMTFVDTDVVRILEEVLPQRFGGGPSDYQLVEELADDEHPRLRLLVHPCVGPADSAAVSALFTEALGSGSETEKLMARQWREGRLLEVERKAPLRDVVGKNPAPLGRIEGPAGRSGMSAETVRTLDAGALDLFAGKGKEGGPNVPQAGLANGVKVRRILQITRDLASKPFDRLRILDLGCGEGAYAIEAGLRGSEVLALDARTERMDKGAACAKRHGLTNVRFVQEDVRNISQETFGSFDVVYLLGLLYHLDAPDVFAVLERIYVLCGEALLIDTLISLNPQDHVPHGGRGSTAGNAAGSTTTERRPRCAEPACSGPLTIRSASGSAGNHC